MSVRKSGFKPGFLALSAALCLLSALFPRSLPAAPSSNGFVWLTSGTFTMGSNTAEANEDEKPAHSVTVSGFYLGAREVTRGEWFAVMGTRPWLDDLGAYREGAHQGATQDEDDQYPASYISWTAAMSYCAARNAAAGGNWFRLPTEAEWEYAARVGSLGSLMAFSPEITDANLGDYAWFRDNTVTAGEPWPHRVGLKLPTRWESNGNGNLYDMHGNVSEWVLDYYGSYAAAAQTNPAGPATGDARITRGGSFQDDAYMPPGSDCSSANRAPTAPAVTNKTIGFRIVLLTAPYAYLPGQEPQGGGGSGTSAKSSSKSSGGGGGCFIGTILSR